MLLRKRLIDWLTAMALTSPIERPADVGTRKPELGIELDALKSLKNDFASAASYYKHGCPAAEGPESSWQQALPKRSPSLHKLVRTVFDGHHDKMLTGRVL